MAWIDEIPTDGSNGNNGSSGGGFFENATDSLSNTVKEVGGETIAKYATEPVKDALGSVAGGLIGDFFDGFFDSERSVPSQYTGNVNQSKPEEELLNSDRYAMYKYNLGDTPNNINDSHPMMKYMFVADFVFNNNEYYRQNLMNVFPKAMTLGLKNTTFPKSEIETEVINRYNRPKVSTRKVRYQPISATFGETVAHLVSGKGDVSMIEIWNTVASYYINDFTIPDSYGTETSRPFGHRSGNDTRNLLKYIDLYFIWRSSTKRLRIVNPYLTGFSYEGLDYSTDDQVTATFDIQYEYYELREVRGDFIEFINNTNAGTSIIGGMPLDFVAAQEPQNLTLSTMTADLDDQRAVNLDNEYAQAAIELAEQEAIQSASSLLGSSDPTEQQLGREALKQALDAGQTAASALGGLSSVDDAVQGIGSSANSYLSGLF